jgi:bacillithiol biosynthesis cysteine-adding enzyme BshC
MNINFSDIKFYPTLIKDYLTGELKKKRIIDWDYSIDSIIQKTAQRKFESREVLLSSLKSQNCDINLSEASIENLKNLKQDNCFTVCTGHQLCIYGGPAYFYSKILEVIKLSKQLNAQQNTYKYVPVFWMASEDHDFEEISEVNLFNNNLKWDYDTKGAVGKLSSDGLREIQNQFTAILGNSEKSVNLSKIFEQAYNSGKNLTQATRYFVNEFFGEYGLLIIDGDDPKLKQCLSPIIYKEIQNKITESSVNKGISRLSEYKTQAKPRPINLFYLNTNYRERIIIKDNTVQTVDGKFNWEIDEFLKIATTNPEEISPNVLLRPVYQELCLPNVAYLGGAGEISYWLELPELFKALEVPFPIPTVRNSYVFLSQKQLDTITALNLKISDFFKDKDIIIKEYLENNSGETIKLSGEKEQLRQLFETIKEKSLKIDRNLSNVVQGELKRSFSAMENMEKRFRNSEKINKNQQTARITKIKSVFFPHGVFQERRNSFFDFIIKSENDLFEQVVNANVPFDNTLKVVVY